MRENCGETGFPQSNAFLLQFTRNSHFAPWPLPWPQQDLATFLLVRGDHSYLGYAWAGCGNASTYVRPEGLDENYGVALGVCKETSPGVFSRNYTRAKVALDCNTFTPSIVQI